MSIASRIESIENHLKDDYTEIARLGADLTNVDKNIENIAETIREAYSKMPKVLGTGSNLSLSPTLKGGLDITPIGACEQDSYSGINQFDDRKLSQTTNYNTYDSQTGLWTTSSESGYTRSFLYSRAGANNRDITKIIKVKPNTKYTIKFYDFVNNTGLTPAITNAYTDNEGTYLSDGNISDFAVFTTPNNCEYLDITRRNNSGTISFSKIMLVEGEYTEQTFPTYEKYVGGTASPNPDYPQPIRVVTGDNDVVVNNGNIFDGLMELGTIGGGTGTSESSTTNIRTNDYIDISLFRNLKIPTSNASTQTIGLRFYNSSKQYLGSYPLINYDTSVIKIDEISIINTTQYYSSNADIYYLRFVVTSSVDLTIKYAVMINNSTTYVEYKPIQSTTLHLGSNYLAGIGDYVDTIEGTKDNWKIVRNIKTRTYNGTENWTYNSPNQCFYLPQSDYLATGFIPYSNYFIGQNVKALVFMQDKHISYCRNNINLLLVKYLDIEQTSEAFKTWLSTHNLIAYYVLATPTEEPVLDTLLISDLNNMYDMYGYDGVTNITITSDSNNAQMTAQVKALKGE